MSNQWGKGGQVNPGTFTTPVPPGGPVAQTQQNMGSVPAVQPTMQPTGPNLGQMSADAYRGALGATFANQMLPPGQIAQTDLTGYLNPFTDAVVDRTMGELNRQRDIALRGVGDAAIAANAFGGDRHGIAEAELGRGYADIQANTLANLYQGGYDQATRLAQQDIANRFTGQQGNLAAAQQLAGLSNLGFGQAQAIQQGLTTQGALQQALQQNLINQAMQQWAGLTGQPAAAQQMLQTGLSGIQLPTTTTQTGGEPGLLDYLSLAAGVGGAALGAPSTSVIGSWLT